MSDLELHDLDGLGDLLKTVDLGDHGTVDVDAILAAGRRQRRARAAQQGLLVAATVAAVALVGSLVTRPAGGAAPEIALPQGVLGPGSVAPFGIALDGVHDGRPTVAVWEEPGSAPTSDQAAAYASLTSLASEQRINLVYRVTTNAGPASGGASLRAAMALGCALDADAGQRYRALLMADPPRDGFTDAELLDLARQAGVTGQALETFRACVQSQHYRAWAEASTAESVAAGVPGVPTAYVDGREIPFADLPTTLGSS